MRGFTLIEAVIVVFMLGLTSLVVTSLYLGQNELYKTQFAELNVTSQARGSLGDIDVTVRNSDVVVLSHSGLTTGTQVLVLQVPSINSSNQIIPGTYDYVGYYLSGTNLQRQIFANPASSRVSNTKTMAQNVSGLAFTLDNASLSQVTQVTTDLTIQEQAGRHTRSITISSKSKLRNN